MIVKISTIINDHDDDDDNGIVVLRRTVTKYRLDRLAPPYSIPTIKLLYETFMMLMLMLMLMLRRKGSDCSKISQYSLPSAEIYSQYI